MCVDRFVKERGTASHTVGRLDVARWVDEIDRVLKSAYAVEAELLGVTSFPPLQRDKQDIICGGNCFIGFISGSNLCGVIELETPVSEAKETTIAALAVAPSHFRQGIGTALVRAALKQEGSFRVTTGVLNQPAIALYTAQGFGLVGSFTTPDGVDMVELVFDSPESARS